MAAIAGVLPGRVRKSSPAQDVAPADSARVADGNAPELLLISHDASETGAPQSLLTFVRWLVATGRARPRIVLAAPGPLEPRFAELCPVYRVWRGEGLLAGAMLASLARASWAWHRRASIGALARSQWRPALVYANTMATGPETAALARPGVPVVTHVRELDTVFAAIGAGRVDTALRQTDRFIANSEATKANLVARHAIAPARIDVVRPFIDCTVAPPDKGSGAVASIRRQTRSDQGERLVIGCGTIHRRKGTDLFIDVAGAIVSRRPARDVRFVWVGGDTSELRGDDMRKMAAERGLSDVISFVGHRGDYLHFLAAADLLLLTSREEPFGRVVLEAGLCGTPTICFADSGGAPEFVRDDAGRVVAREDVHAMAMAAIELLDSRALCVSLGARARERVLAEHSVAAGAPRILAVIEGAIAAGAMDRKADRAGAPRRFLRR